MDNPTSQITSNEKSTDHVSGASSNVSEAEILAKQNLPLESAVVAKKMTAPKERPNTDSPAKNTGVSASVVQAQPKFEPSILRPPILKPPTRLISQSYSQSERTVVIHIPDEIKPIAGAILRCCFDYIDYVHEIASKTVYMTEPSEKFMALVDCLAQEPRPSHIFYTVTRHIGVAHDPNSNFGQLLDLTKFSVLCWRILDKWSVVKNAKTTDDQTVVAGNLIIDMRIVMTCEHFLSKKYVHPKFYENCVQILSKFCFHPVDFLRGMANKELRRLRRMYKCCRNDSVLENHMNRTAVKVLCRSMETGYDNLKDDIEPWKNMMKMVLSCGMPEIEMFCTILVPRIFENLPHLEETVFEALNALFASRTTNLPLKCIEVILPEMYGLLLKYNYYQSSDITAVKWLLVMQEVHVHLFRLYISKACEMLPEIFQAVQMIEEKTFSRSESQTDSSLSEAIFETYRTLLSQIVAPVCDSKELAVQYAPQLRKCFEVVTSNVTRYKAEQVFVLMIDSAGQNCANLWIDNVQNFEDLGRGGLAAAIRVLGLEIVLQKFPLEEKNGDLNLTRVYVIELLKENIRASRIQCFFDRILPLALYCLNAAKSKGKQSYLYNTFKTRADQLLKLLPYFCAAAPDLEANFEHLAPMIIDFIENHESLRSAGLMTLQKCLFNAKISKKQEVLEVVRKYEKNFLPLLYDLYLTEPTSEAGDSDRLLALDCLKMLFAISKTALTKDTILKAVANLNVDSNDPKTAFVKRSIIQLFTILLPWLNCQLIRVIYVEYLKHLPKIENEAEQKDAYRLLKRICSNLKHSGSRKFVATNKKKLHSLLWDCLDKPFLFDNRRARLKLLTYLMMAQPCSNSRSIMVNMVAHEAMWTLNGAKLTVKEKNMACDALICVFRCFWLHKETNLFMAMIAFNLFIPEPARDNLKSEILAVTCILRNFSDVIGPRNVRLLFDAVIIAMKVPLVAVLSASMTFLRVYFSLLPGTPEPDTLSTIFQSLSAIPSKIKAFLRKQIEIAFVELLKKCSYEQLKNYVLEADDLLANLLHYAAYSPCYSLAIRATRDKFNHVTDPDEFLPKATRQEDILTDSDFSDVDDSCVEVDFDESLRERDDEDSESDSSSCSLSQDEYVISEAEKSDDKTGNNVAVNAAKDA